MRRHCKCNNISIWQELMMKRWTNKNGTNQYEFGHFIYRIRWNGFCEWRNLCKDGQKKKYVWMDFNLFMKLLLASRVFDFKLYVLLHTLVGKKRNKKFRLKLLKWSQCQWKQTFVYIFCFKNTLTFFSSTFTLLMHGKIIISKSI